MTTKREAKQAVTELRRAAPPEFKDHINAVADCMNGLIENAAAELGRMGGTARAKKLSKKRRSEIARTAVKAREEKRRGSKKSK